MADSNMTKKALASALKELMKTVPFSKISVGDICNMCEMNRKSFYYHFKDKYDLINWIYTSEFVVGLQNKIYDSEWNILEDLCDYFYENRDFYRKALQIKGQNSFSDHFREYIRPLIAERISTLFGEEQPDEFTLDFLSDAMICAMERWLLSKECMPPEQFVNKLKTLTEKCAHAIFQEMSQAEQGPS